MNNLSLVISREYVSRVKKKGFIITTLVMPVIFVLLMLAPTLLSSLNDGPESIVVVDETDSLSTGLAKSGLPFVFAQEPLDSVLQNEDNKIVLVVGKDAIDNPDHITLYNREAPSFELQMVLTETLNRAIEDVRLEHLGKADVRETLNQVAANVEIKSLKINDQGETENSNVLVSFIIGMGMSFILYMFIIIYGQMVMTSIIEEKNNRVLEILVTSVKPFQLMTGKLIGIGAVAVTQVLIWLVIVASFIAFVMPGIGSGGILAEITTTQLLGQVTSIFGYLIVFLIGGFLLYASVYAAIGASVDNIQDASQFQTFAIVPVIIALVVSMTVAENPDSEMATIFSLIPFTSPMVMMSRIPAGVPFWEIAASIVLLAATIFLMIWLSAKIYRVGIFMYGKKPTLKELVKWAKYK